MEPFTILELQARMHSGELTARGLTEYYLTRIEQIDRGGPRLNAVIELNPEAQAQADALDAERARSGPRSPLHGIPLLLKDNIDTADRMTTTTGSLALEGHIAAQDAYLVGRLRQAGALLLGKTNLSEWANFRSTHSSSGWSSRGGQTRNPYALNRTPCGSSSGSGAAVAADLCAAAVGTETDGSVVCPSHINGIVGLKPTLGLISRSGVIPIAAAQDTAGPMARTVSDAAVLLGGMVGAPDPRDPETAAGAGRIPLNSEGRPDYTLTLDPDGLRGARIGIARSYFGFDSRVDRIIEACIDILRAAGAEIVDPVNVIAEDKLARYEIEVLLTEFKAGVNAYLQEALQAEADPEGRNVRTARAGLKVRSFADVIRFNEANRSRVMPFFGQERMLLAARKRGLDTQRYRQALEKGRRLAREGIDRPLREHRLDAILAPSGAPAWLIDLVNGDNYTPGGFSAPAAVAGYPHITVPAGYVFGLPVGLSLFASAWSEPTLLRLAFAFEQAAQVRRPPQFLSEVDFTAPEIS